MYIQAGSDNPQTPFAKKLHYYINKTALKSILNVALDVHMVHTGAMEYYSDYLKDVSLLMWAITHWGRGSPPSQKFDDSVKSLILATLEEFEHNKRYMTWLDYSVLDDPEYFTKEKLKCTRHERD